jgi:hypothetical protein
VIASPPKRSLKDVDDDGRKERVGGAGDVDANRLPNEVATDPVVAGVGADPWDTPSVVQRDANGTLLWPATWVGGVPWMSAGRTGVYARAPRLAGSPPNIIQAHTLNANVSPAEPATTDATPTRTKGPRPPMLNAARPKHAASRITGYRIREIRRIWLSPGRYFREALKQPHSERSHSQYRRHIIDLIMKLRLSTTRAVAGCQY